MTNYADVNWGEAASTKLADLAETKEKMGSKGGFESKKVDLKRYFTTFLNETEKEGKKIFRILPSLSDPYEFVDKVYFHNILIGKKWTKVYDPSQNGTIDKKSPLNDVRKALNAHPDKEVSKQASKYKPRLFYVVRGVERGAEQDGVKFWRFGAVNDQSGVMDKIESLISHYNGKTPGGGAIWNPIAGRDLIITMNKDDKNRTKITSIIADDPSPLHEDKDTANKFLSDASTWKDMYKQYNMDFLNLLAEGETPEWSREANGGKGGYVAKTDNMAAPSSVAASAPAATFGPAAPSQPQAAQYGEMVHSDLMDDLPF